MRKALLMVLILSLSGCATSDKFRTYDEILVRVAAKVKQSDNNFKIIRSNYATKAEVEKRFATKKAVEKLRHECLKECESLVQGELSCAQTLFDDDQTFDDKEQDEADQ